MNVVTASRYELLVDGMNYWVGPYPFISLPSPTRPTGPPIKKKLFPVQRVAEIVVSRAAATKNRLFFGGKKIKTFFEEKKGDNKKTPSRQEKLPVGKNILTQPLHRKQTFL